MEHQNITAETSPQTAVAVSSFKGLFEVFYQPAAWFEKLRSKPKVLVPYLVLFAVYVVCIWAMKDVLADMIAGTPEVQEKLQSGEIPSVAAEWLWVGGAVSMVFAGMFAPLVGAALALFWGNVVFAGKASFKSLLSVMLYGELIYAAGNLLILPLVLAKDSLTVGLNLGILAADRGLQDVLYTALSKIDIFIIWEIIVIGIGLSMVYGFARNKGMWLSVLSMGLMTVVGVAAAFIGSMF